MTFGIIGNIAKPGIKDITKNLLAYLAKKNISFVLHERLSQFLKSADKSISREIVSVSETELPERCDLLIVLGGDGTMLAATHIVGKHEIPILGVNLGKLGFLADVSVEELHQCIGDILKGDYVVEERMVLQATGASDAQVFYGLNEVVIDKGASPRVIELETYVNNDYLVTYAADGIMVTTPTGSTGYSLATGGPLVAPQSSVIIIAPIAPHTLTARPVIVPEASVIKVIAKSPSKSVHITADGQIEAFYSVPAEFEVRKADYNVKLVKGKRHTFYDLLRTKLMWGRDVRVGTGK